MKKIAIVATMLFSLVQAGRGIAAPVKVWQGTLTLPTYEENNPDTNPQFDVYESERFNYPYTLRDNLSDQEKPHAWRALFLENEYLKCSVLPDIGGHIYTCTDKISGKPMFYANPSIKKAKIGYRGAWAAFGLEFNFPVSHNWVTMSPVDFSFASHNDGSASIWIGNVDRPYGMQWRVELVLRPASTALEERVTLYNRSEVRHRYYWWDNAGVEVWNDSRIAYPMQFVASHGYKEVYKWPIGPTDKDLSILSNHTEGPVSYFVHGSREPYMGIWNPHTQTGTVHYAEFRDLPAKKIWSWGVDPAGLAWRKALSDNDSAYVEVQAGLFRNQETYSFLDPGQSISFRELWMPVRDTGGITRVTPAGIVNVERSEAGVKVALNVNQPIAGARLLLTQDGKVLAQQTSDLVPEKTWQYALPNLPAEPAVHFELQDAGGHVLLAHTEGVFDWDPAAEIKTGPQQAVVFPPPASRSADDWLQVGLDQELNGKVLAALDTYRDGLARFPSSQSLLVAAGRLAVGQLRSAEAEPWLAQALARDTSNAEVAYYLGLAREALGQLRDAEAAYEVAFRQAAFRAPAAIRLGEIHARKGDLGGALEYFRAATAAEPDHVLAREEYEAVLRARGEVATANEVARQGMAADPTGDFLKVELGQPDLDHLAADPNRLLQSAAEYMRLGLYQRALDLLVADYPAVSPDRSEPGTVRPQDNPLVHYYAAYCNQKLGLSGDLQRRVARQLPITFIFPHSAADLDVLQAALASDASDATGNYLLGTQLFARGELDAGIDRWEQARQLAPQMPVVDADLGTAYLRVRHDTARALNAYRAGLKNDAGNAAIYSGLEVSMTLQGASAADLAAALEQYPNVDVRGSKAPANLVYQLALTRAEAGKFEAAEQLFDGRFFPSEEGGISSAEVLFEVRLMQAESQAQAGACKQAEEFVETQAKALPEAEATARTYVRFARVAAACGKKVEARDWFNAAMKRTSNADLPWALAAERALGHDSDAATKLRLEQAIGSVQVQLSTTSHAGETRLLLGELQQAAQQKEAAKESLRATLLLADAGMSHHFARLALAGR